MHSYLNWAKQRIDEMDAALTSIEAGAAKAMAESRVKADQTIAELKKCRSEFAAAAKKQAEEGEAAVQRTKAQMDGQWTAFQSQLDKYFETVGRQIEQQQAAFGDIAAAQVKAWREAAEKLKGEAAKTAAAKRAEADAAVERMKAGAAEAERHLQDLKSVAGQSWSAFSAALLQSRKNFEQANEAAWDAVKRAASTKEKSPA